MQFPFCVVKGERDIPFYSPREDNDARKLFLSLRSNQVKDFRNSNLLLLVIIVFAAACVSNFTPSTLFFALIVPPVLELSEVAKNNFPGTDVCDLSEDFLEKKDRVMFEEIMKYSLKDSNRRLYSRTLPFSI
jgi:hypothetical protein